jgi:hypothetical protein
MALRDAFLSVSSPPLASSGAGGDQILGLIYDLADSLESYVTSQKMTESDLALIDKPMPDFSGVADDQT